MLLKFLSVVLTCWLSLFSAPGKRTEEEKDTCKGKTQQEGCQQTAGTGYDLSTVDYLILNI